ncbi:MAG TPA: discoidin domain-containing protein, partial [Acidimicrobiales bacterium]|nr:discoidin domain-containing protein [Acidimicrobiales bacterium]
SHTDAGETITFPTETFSKLRITIDATTWTAGKNLGAAAGVGFAEVGIPGVNIRQTIQMPTDLLDALGKSSLSHRLVVIFTRQKVGPYPPRSDPELSMSRSFELPTSRTFTVGGDATISALIADNDIDDILGGPDLFDGNVLGSNERLPGDLNARAVYAFDGNPSTWWGPGFDAKAQVGAWMQANLTHPVTFDYLNLQVLADGQHSVPTKLEITTNTGQRRTVVVPPITDGSTPGHTVTVHLSFPAVTGSVLRFTIEAVRQVTTTDWYTSTPIVLPFAIAEIGVPGLHFTPENPASSIPPVCRGNLMTIDGKPVWLKVTGKVGTAEKGGDLSISGCGPDANGVKLGPGKHVLETVWGDTTGLNLDRLTLDSAAGGGAEALLPDGDLTPVAGTLSGNGVAALPAPAVKVLSTTGTSARLQVSGASGPFWLVLGESVNKGWQANIVGGPALGTSSLIDAFANGWYVRPGTGGTFDVDLVWTPQKKVDDALVASAVALLACVLLAVVPFAWLRRKAARKRTGRPRRLRPGAHARAGKGGSSSETDSSSPETSHPPAVDDRPPAGASRRLSTDDAPALAFPWSRAGQPTSVVTTVVLALVATGVTWAVIPAPWAEPIAAAVGVAALLAGRWRGFRTLFALAALGCAAAAGLITVLGQYHHRFPPGDGWPTNFETASIVTLVAFAALAGDAVVEAGRLRRLATTEQEPPAGQDEPTTDELAAVTAPDEAPVGVTGDDSQLD